MAADTWPTDATLAASTVNSFVLVRNRWPANADDVTDIQGLKQIVTFFAEPILARVNLQSPAPILNVKKRGFPHAPDRHDPARHTRPRRLRPAIFVAQLSAVGDNRLEVVWVGLKIVGIRIDCPAVSELGELLPAHFDLLADSSSRHWIRVSDIVIATDSRAIQFAN